MSEDDPFSPIRDDDRTVIRPTPGGMRPRPGAAGAQRPPMPSQPASPVPDFGTEAVTQGSALFAGLAGGSTLNAVVVAAMPLLSLTGRLRQTAIVNDVNALQQRMVGEIREFENRILKAGLGQEQARWASYVLCSFLDETVLNTPWGSQSAWGHQSLLVIFHREAWGGERFFDICTQAMRQPASHQSLLELCYLILSLGFQGKYRLVNQGGNALEQLRSELYQLIQRMRGDFERDLSPRWRGLRDLRPALMRYVPLWVVGAIAALCLLLAYLGFALSINGVSDPVYKQLIALRNLPVPTCAPCAVPRIEPRPNPGRADRFKRLLGREIGANMVEVVDDNVLRIRNSFNSGSDQLKPEFLPMLSKIAKELEAGQDRVLVTGHTDDKPIVSARFPSNWHLSNSRAKHVADILVASTGMTGKVGFEGRADGEPLSPNDTAEHRALNRRVDILIR